MAAPALQLQHAVERAQQASQARLDGDRLAYRLRVLRLVVPEFDWFEPDHDWELMQAGALRAYWPGLYRLQVRRLGPAGGPWRWSVATLSGTELRHDIVRRRRDAKDTADRACRAMVAAEREQLERETA